VVVIVWDDDGGGGGRDFDNGLHESLFGVQMGQTDLVSIIIG
jgi:hypothetical protein